MVAAGMRTASESVYCLVATAGVSQYWVRMVTGAAATDCTWPAAAPPFTGWPAPTVSVPLSAGAQPVEPASKSPFAGPMTAACAGAIVATEKATPPKNPTASSPQRTVRAPPA